MSELNLKTEQNIESVEKFEFEQEPMKGQPELKWRGKRPFNSTQFFPAQLKETYGEEVDGWMNKVFWGDNLQVMSHLLKYYRGQVDLIYIDPPYDSKADYKKRIELRGKETTNDQTVFEEKQYTDIWSNDEYLQFMYERLIIMRELLSERGTIYLHCDWHKIHLLRCIMDEVFGSSSFRNEIIWKYTGSRAPVDDFPRKHDNILRYSKTQNGIFNIQYEDYEQGTINRFNMTEPETGRRYKITYRDGKEYKTYMGEGKPMEDVWDLPIVMKNAIQNTDYPTQKPEALLERIIKVSSNPGDLVFDCFMGSGTTQAVAMKLGRRFIGADINLGAIDTTVKRLNKIAKEIAESISEDGNPRYTGFEVYNVNNYDVFRNPIQAKDLLIQALELQPLPGNELYDGEKDGRMVKIMPVNRIATRGDLNE
jgi:adenine specific DNA methylase Mod